MTEDKKNEKRMAKSQRMKERLESFQLHEVSTAPTIRELRKKDRPRCLAIKEALFTQCGKVCMFKMKKFASKKNLVLHHDPPFRECRHTEFDNSFILSEDAHLYLTELEFSDKEKYEEEMMKIRRNKILLLEKK